MSTSTILFESVDMQYATFKWVLTRLTSVPYASCIVTASGCSNQCRLVLVPGRVHLILGNLQVLVMFLVPLTRANTLLALEVVNG